MYWSRADSVNPHFPLNTLSLQHSVFSVLCCVRGVRPQHLAEALLLLLGYTRSFGCNRLGEFLKADGLQVSTQLLEIASVVDGFFEHGHGIDTTDECDVIGRLEHGGDSGGDGLNHRADGREGSEHE